MAESTSAAAVSTTTTTATNTMAVPTLPSLPDPNTFWSQPGPSSLFLLQEARANISIFNDLKTHIQSGTMSMYFHLSTGSWPRADSRLQYPPTKTDSSATHT
jgi:hypothetical protein